MKIDRRFLTGQGPEIFTGSELLIKGALEADGGVHLLCGYPGSPIAGFFDTMTQIKDLLSEKGICAVINNNEALAVAMLNGSQVAGCRGIVCMKSVGVHVAADALALGSLAGAHPDGGAVVIYGDDPWSDSTQVPVDSRYISKHLFIPVIEPSYAQEVKDFINLSLELSRRAELYSGIIIPTNLADGGGSVICAPNQYPSVNTLNKMDFITENIDLDKYVLLPPRTWWREESYSARFARAIAAAKDLGLNKLSHSSESRSPIGFVSSGMAHSYLIQALEEMNLTGEFPILKFAMTYPMDGDLVRQLTERCERIIVIEERRGFLEEQVIQIVVKLWQSGKIPRQTEVWGKEFPGGLEGIPSIRGLHPSILISRLGPLLKSLCVRGVSVPTDAEGIDRELATIEGSISEGAPSLPARIPTFCPGCPHRDSASLSLEIKKRFMDRRYMREQYHSDPVDLVFHGDVGCYTMLMFPPNTPLMHNLSGMGLGGGTGTGMDPFITNKQVVFMGDSTFFHSGQIAVSQAVKLGQDITFIILDNATTGMTGHQPTPGVNYDIVGNLTPTQDIEEIISGIAGNSNLSVVRVDPEKRKEYRRLLEETFLSDGVKVVIADKECGITLNRRQRRQRRTIQKRLGYLPSWERMNINQEICRFCLACCEMTGCPGLKHVQTDYGQKMDTDISWCVNDGACQRIGACNAFERVIIKRKHPPRSRLPELGLDEIPEPQKQPVGDLWRCCLAGVGGMGLGVATSVIVRAGHKEGYEVVFLDKKGLAIRNGGTVSQVVYNIAHQPVTALIPYGKADLLIGMDILEAARALDPMGRMRIATKDRTAAVINTDKISTINGLMGREDFDPEQLEKFVHEHTRNDDYLARNISRICETYLGNKLYSNIMMLGFAFQKGFIPVSMHSMAWAIKDTIGTDFRKNLYAFNMGRKLVVQPDLFQGPHQRTGWTETLEEKTRDIIRRYRRGQQLSTELRESLATDISSMNQLAEPLKRALVIRAYDCMRWGGLDYTRRYLKNVLCVYLKDRREYGFAATQAVIFNLASAMLIKDEIFLGELSTSPEKYARDRKKYNVNPTNGDKIIYRHLWNCHIKIGSRTFSARITVYDWMLQILKRCRWLRRVLPWWGRTKRQYLREYERRIVEFEYDSAVEYEQGLRSLESAQCINCTNPRCQQDGCPLGNNVAEWVWLVYENRWREAYQELEASNNFPEFTSLICPGLCQDACKQNLSGYPVQIRDIEGRIIERAFEQGWVTPQISSIKTARRVAIVGSGPAGLACAQQLARKGHEVVIYETDDEPGGLLRYGIPDFRLDKALIDRRIEQLRQEGVSFHTGVEVGKDISAKQLLGKFDAVCLATGARLAKDLPVPGRDQEGIYLAMDLLRANNLRTGGQSGATDEAISAKISVKISVKNKVVAIIGGGETGADCVETALLQGAAEVHQLEILPRPAKESNEGFEAKPCVHRQWNVKTIAFTGKNGRVDELSGLSVNWINSPDGLQMREVPGSEFHIKVDMIVLATGYDAVLSTELIDQLCLEIDGNGKVIVKEFRTSIEGVFAVGDLVTGPSYVATAIDSGRKAAKKIDKYLDSISAEIKTDAVGD